MQFEFSAQTRRQWLADLASTPTHVDTLIVGGGIVGVGLARELALRGHKPLLVEKNDFASGTSSKSTKLIHGGLRYLEMLDFGLVFEALAERHWLLQTHPHLVAPLEFNFPVYSKTFRSIGERPPWLVNLGLWFYDSLSLFRTPFFHGKHSKADTEKLFPGLKNKGLDGSHYYADAMMLDDELVLETACDSVRRGAKLLNYTKVLSVKKRKDGKFETLLQDEYQKTNAPILVTSDEVAVCVGPWTNIVDSIIDGGSEKKLKPSRGIHLVLPWDKLPIERCVVMSRDDKRIIFAIPRSDIGTEKESRVVVIGTTDAPEHGIPDEIVSEKFEIDYLLDTLNLYFPKNKITSKDVIMAFAGVRPLLDSGAASEAKTSREHEIWRNKQGIVFMAGGKYTTFRCISQELASFIYPKSESSADRSKEPLSDPKEYQTRFTGEKILGRFTTGWFEWKIKNHCSLTLEDLIFRRSPFWMFGRKIGDKQIEAVSQIAAKCLSWSEDTRLTQVTAVKAKIAKDLSNLAR